MSRITCPELSTKTATAAEAARHIDNGQRVAMSGFTGSGYPKAVPGAVAARARAAHDRDEDFRVELWTGA
ncbi:hypothetical protein [Brevibacterium limosum]|uniref:hypothetical protein n=1 Tax=Brevibacterium limosum TaxID=2697565 RepID=UPI001421A107|nr:hypothetical protein [Brevibacterium limosum]